MSTLTAPGGFTAPDRLLYAAVQGISAFASALPAFSAVRGGIDFTPPHVRWAKQHERELRAARKAWDWPTAPEVSR